MPAPAIYDPLNYVALDDPFPVYQRLRDELPVYRNPSRGFWALSRYGDVQAASRDWRTYSNRPSIDLDDDGSLFGPGDFLNLDPPRHDSLRDIVHALFRPRSIAPLSADIREVSNQLIDSFIENDVVDIAHEYAWQLPATMLTRLLGLPRSDVPLLVSWALELVRRDCGSDQVPESAQRTVERLQTYFETRLADRVQSPGSDVVSALAEAERNKALTRNEVIGICYLLFAAGTETTASLIGQSLRHLGDDPDLAARLRAAPELMPEATEEFLRLYSPVQQLARTATRDVELHGETIPAGARVVLIHGSANRDDRRFEQADTFNLERPKQRTLAFGEGIHFCLGAPLARPEGAIAVEVFLQRIGHFEPAGLPERTPTHTAFGYQRLPMRLTPAAGTSRPASHSTVARAERLSEQS